VTILADSTGSNERTEILSKQFDGYKVARRRFGEYWYEPNGRISGISAGGGHVLIAW